MEVKLKNILSKVFQTVIFIAVISALVFYFEPYLNSGWNNLNRRLNPCEQPIVYSIGDVDKRFGLSRNEFADMINRAALIWDKAAGKTLFKYEAVGGVKINLVYDARQESTMKLKSLGLNISTDKASYEILKSKYDAFNKTYQAEKAQLDGMVSYYNQRLSDYQDEVKAANRRGGATPDEAAILEQERKEINALADSIKQKQDAVNKIVDDLNALANVMNKLIYELNLNVSRYNTIGAASAGEFQEGVYISDNSGERINIYQFDDKQALLRVLAHELGHALGLEHVDDPKAIMYRLNESGNEKPTAADLGQLKAVCRLK